MLGGCSINRRFRLDAFNLTFNWFTEVTPCDRRSSNFREPVKSHDWVGFVGVVGVGVGEWWVLCGGGWWWSGGEAKGGWVFALGVGRCVFRGLGQDFTKMAHFRPSETISGNTVPTYQVLLDGFGLKHT